MSDRPPTEALKDIAVCKGVVVGRAGRRDLLGDLYGPRPPARAMRLIGRRPRAGRAW